nr:MAG TPA: hypothetical protein [Caudoviricetes sp.]
MTEVGKHKFSNKRKSLSAEIIPRPEPEPGRRYQAQARRSRRYAKLHHHP